MKKEKPWLPFYGDVPAEPDVSERSLYGELRDRALLYPNHHALEYLGAKFTFSKLIRLIDLAAAALKTEGVRQGDCVTLALPNVPNAVILFYALNKIGARVSMVHPLSPPADLEYYLKKADSKLAVTLDLFVSKFVEILDNTPAKRLLVVSVADYLPRAKALLYALKNKTKVPADARIFHWKGFLSAAPRLPESEPEAEKDCRDGSVILFSGGTSNMPKGILLNDYAFNSLAESNRLLSGFGPKDRVIAIMPIFHGFGLGLCVHTILLAGGTSILIPKFSPENYIKALIKHEPQFIAGVPTLFEALLRHPDFKKARFDKLKGAYSGGDLLSPETKSRFDTALRAQGSPVDLLEGYGTTECVTGCVLTPAGRYKKGSIGIPIPNMETCIAKVDTIEVLGPNTEGEICVAGPQLMLGYLDDWEATAKALKVHADGKLWLHTGDHGYMDEDGYLYYKSRIRRIFKVSGINVYPSQVESILESHPAVARACVLGVPDDYQVTRVKAFVVLLPPYKETDALTDELRAYCAERLIKWSVPRTFEFCPKLPTTLVGKVAYTELERLAK